MESVKGKILVSKKNFDKNYVLIKSIIYLRLISETIEDSIRGRVQFWIREFGAGTGEYSQKNLWSVYSMLFLGIDSPETWVKLKSLGRVH